jgi:hypothetical protein
METNPRRSTSVGRRAVVGKQTISEVAIVNIRIKAIVAALDLFS